LSSAHSRSSGGKTATPPENETKQADASQRGGTAGLRNESAFLKQITLDAGDIRVAERAAVNEDLRDSSVEGDGREAV